MSQDFVINHDQVEISLSKKKIFFLLLGSIAFVAGGIFFVLSPAELRGSDFHYRPKWEILTIGYLCIIFFGTGVLVFIFQLFNKNPGLVINDQGITINPGLFSTTLIEWGLIKGFNIISISRANLITINLKNPQEYIDNLSSPFKRKIASFSLKNYGTPISISANSLTYDTNELYTLLTERLKVMTPSSRSTPN